MSNEFKHTVLWESRGLEDAIDHSARLISFEDMYFLELFTPNTFSFWNKLKICWNYLLGRTTIISHSLAMSWEDLINMKKRLDRVINKRYLLEHKRKK